MKPAVISPGDGVLPGPDASLAEQSATRPGASPRCPHCGCKSRYAIPAPIGIEAIRARLQSGDNFASLADEYGIDRSTFRKWCIARGLSLAARLVRQAEEKTKSRWKCLEGYQRVYRELRMAAGVEVARSQIAALAAKEEA
jgi:transposase-like protein